MATEVDGSVYEETTSTQELEIIERLKKMLSLERLEHSELTAQEAGDLAACHNLGEGMANKAELAGLLHDVAKEFTDEQNREYIEKYGLDEELLKPEMKNFVHAEVGAAVAKAEFGMDEEIAEAIRYHTIPSPKMTELDKIVFLADKFGRDWGKYGERGLFGKHMPKWLQKIHQMSEKNLDKAMLMFLEAQEKHLAEKGIEQHPRARETMVSLASPS